MSGQATTHTPMADSVFVRIIEGPSKSLRYRYVCERRPGTIPGASSTRENKTPFTVEVVGYRGKVKVVVSCVTHTPPHRPHPHSLSGPHCKNGYCSMKTEVSKENPYISFPKLAVQCVKRHDVKAALKLRKEKNVDPFSAGFQHGDDVKAIDLNVVRLCVQVFLREGSESFALAPVVSEPICNKKTIPDPVIYRLSHCNSYVHGREEDIILLCARISKEDIKIRFFERKNGQDVWEDYGRFSPNNVFNNSAICFRPPRYHSQDITEPAKVSVQLLRPSDGSRSSPVAFEYLPTEAEPGALKEKRRKYRTNPLFNQLFHMGVDVAMAGEETQWTPPAPLPRPTSGQMVPYLEDSSSSSYQFSLYDDPFNPYLTPMNDLSIPSSSNFQSKNTVNYNIMNSDDFPSDSDINLENASAVRKILNLDNGDQIHLRDIHISSGELEMGDVDGLSGSFQDNLVMK